ncbi:thioredoxin family protein [Erysipelothrix sp. D19-032]
MQDDLPDSCRTIEVHADKATIVKVNVDEEGELAQRFDVMSIPTLILFKDGKPVGRKTGFMPKPELEKFITSPNN